MKNSQEYSICWMKLYYWTKVCQICQGIMVSYYSNSSTKRSHFFVFGAKHFLFVDAHGGALLLHSQRKKGW
jgi:hypothetical protein